MARTRVPDRILAVFFLLLVPASASGQAGDSGSIVGAAMDQSGAPIKGIRVVAASDTQIGGAKVAYTNEEGTFRIRGLIPGTFEVRTSAPKLKTVVQKNVQVGINAAAEVNIVMEVENAATEEVKVVEKAPLVSTTTANIKETYDLEFVEHLPFDERDNAHRQLLNMSPGVRNQRVRGGAQNQTLFTQDGFDMKEVFPTMKTSAAFEVQTGAYGADAPTASGGVINMVTKSGSNKWELGFNATSDFRGLEFFKDRTDATLGRERHVLNPTVAGPIVKDRLWFYFNWETHFQRDGIDKDPFGIAPDPPMYDKLINKGTFKLTWQVSSRNKLSSLSTYDLAIEDSRRRDSGVLREAQEARRTGRLFQGLIWESLLSDDMLFRSQAGLNYFPQHIFPSLCLTQPAECDHIPAVRQTFPRQIDSGNNLVHQRPDQFIAQFANRLEWFVSTKHLGEHSLRIKDQFYGEQQINRTSRPGDRLIQLNGLTPDRETVYYSNDPRTERERFGWYITQGTFWRHTTTLSDSWKPTRSLTATPAVSHIYTRGWNNRGDSLLPMTAIAPALALAWDATGDGRTVLRGSASNYVDAALDRIVMHTVGEQVSRQCRYNAATEQFDTACVWAGGRNRNTYNSPCGPSGIDERGRDCRTRMKLPRTWEYTAGAEREVATGVALALDFVYRKFANQYEARETNRIWTSSGEAVSAYRNGRREAVMDMGTPDEAQRRYVGATVGLSKREGAFKAQGSYTWGKLDGTVFDGTGNRFGDIAPRDVYLVDGPLPEDRRHEIKLTGTYQWASWLSTGLRYQYFSGTPYDRTFYNDELGGFQSLRAQTGTNPGQNLNDPADDRELRLPDLQSVNVQVRLNLEPLLGQQLDFYVDVLNVLALRTPTRFGQEDGRNFGVADQRMEPFRIRLGLNYRY